jgi:site-specific recombinase XerC
MCPEQPVDVPKTEDIQGLLETCASRAFDDRRDDAIIRLFADSAIRLSELIRIKTEELDLTGGVVGVTGKGDRYRIAPFGTKTAKALDRYLRVRHGHRDAE